MFPSATAGSAVAHGVHPPTHPAHHTPAPAARPSLLLREKSVPLVEEAVGPEEGVLWFGALVAFPGKRGVTHN